LTQFFKAGHSKATTSGQLGMLTALDADPAQLDRHEQNFVEKIREHGWFGTHVAADNEAPGFGFTTGFWLKFGLPELIVFSLSRQAAHDTFWHMFRELKTGKRFAIREPQDGIFRNVAAVLLPVSKQEYQSYLGWSRWFYGGDEFQCLQLVFPDANGYFPWANGATDDFRWGQPDLTGSNWLRLGHH
jgi:hypothetical protein